METYMYGNFEQEEQEVNPTDHMVLVETVNVFRVRYVIPVPNGKEDWALDSVTCDEAVEFSQECLGETIVSHRVITDEEALALSDEDNDYADVWSDEQKRAAFYTSPVLVTGDYDVDYFLRKNP